MMEPLCIEAGRTGLLEEKAVQARTRLLSCDLCPRECGVNRLEGERGVCRGGAQAEISSTGAHYGEEPPLVGWGGSGTIFFTHCGLRCIFCQNYDISRQRRGREVSATELSGMMIELQRQGCHNINFVTPSHYLPQILEALLEAVPAGLQIPLVWNCGGYESVDSLSLLEGIVDIYMPDIKCADLDPAENFFQAPDYYARAKESVTEMHRQAGDLTVTPEGIAERGLLVRHLVLPGGLAGTEEVARFLAEEISRETYVNIMEQYRPCGEAQGHREIGRPITAEEYGRARELAARAGLHRGFV
jgi:putative pyruvate formate lyase activating enzyme